LSWVGLAYCLHLTGFGYQTGFTPWWHWMKGRPLPRREFHAVGPYRFTRHPTYLCFLGLVWFTPVITADRALLMGVWTTYVFVGSYLKDRRLSLLLGETYRQYRAQVPAYPLMTWPPLGRRRSFS
jgi:methanethiol S-methyltransferase